MGLPLLDVVLEQPLGEKFVTLALAGTDERVRAGKPVSPGFLFAALLWPALPARVMEQQQRGLPPIPAMQEAAHELIAEQPPVIEPARGRQVDQRRPVAIGMQPP